MTKMKLLVDTNIFVDYLNRRDPFYEKARLLMVAGYAGEFELWASASQFTDLAYILSDGGKPSLVPSTLERLRGMRKFVEVFPASDREVDLMLASPWRDPEDALLFEIALRLGASYIITRNGGDFESPLVPAVGCDEFFDIMKEEHGLDYGIVSI